MGKNSETRLRIEYRFADDGPRTSGEWLIWSVCPGNWGTERAGQSVSRLRKAYPRKYEFRLHDAQASVGNSHEENTKKENA